MARGQDGFAIPFLYDSFIHYSTPVYPDAIQAKAPAPQKRKPMRANVRQTLSSVNPAISAIVSQLP